MYFPKRACFSYKEIVELLEGKMVACHGMEFIYDGTEPNKVQDAVNALVKKNAIESREVISKK